MGSLVGAGEEAGTSLWMSKLLDTNITYRNDHYKNRTLKRARDRLQIQEPADMGIKTLEEIRDMWAMLLIYSAGKSKANMHAAQLSKGGELLTFAWLLMAHLQLGDVGEQFEFLFGSVPGPESKEDNRDLQWRSQDLTTPRAQIEGTIHDNSYAEEGEVPPAVGCCRRAIAGSPPMCARCRGRCARTPLRRRTAVAGSSPMRAGDAPFRRCASAPLLLSGEEERMREGRVGFFWAVTCDGLPNGLATRGCESLCVGLGQTSRAGPWDFGKSGKYMGTSPLKIFARVGLGPKLP
uniref:DUF4220 domain-containing protein n=1 Tax=Oryza sativa subsp. japonica TaxID=39947 RepID=Q9FWG0_ORYSJ|nr:hypothetical protein [Oryza sativa Japonica Group]